MIHHNGAGVLNGLPNPFEAIRYHSLVVYPETVPDSLEVTAHSENGLIMAIRHKEHPVEGIQFHPESIMTPDGKALLQNYLNQVARSQRGKGSPNEHQRSEILGQIAGPDSMLPPTSMPSASAPPSTVHPPRPRDQSSRQYGITGAAEAAWSTEARVTGTGQGRSWSG